MSGSTGLCDDEDESHTLLEGLEGLVGLKRLDLSLLDFEEEDCAPEARASVLKRVAHLQGLTHLDVSGFSDRTCFYNTTPIGRQLTVLQELTNLRSLCCMGLCPSGWPLFHVIEALPFLSEVDLSRAHLPGDWDLHLVHLPNQFPIAFQKHKALQKLKMSCTWSQHSLQALKGLPSLAIVDVVGTTDVGDPCLGDLPALTHLKADLDSYMYFNGNSMVHIASLRELVLFPNRLLMGNKLCSELLQLSQLRVLEICGERVHSTVFIQVTDQDWKEDLSLTSRLLTHPGLTRLAWTQLCTMGFKSHIPIVATEASEVQVDKRWGMVAKWRHWCRHTREYISLACDLVGLAEFVASADEDDKYNRYFDIIYTRADQ